MSRDCGGAAYIEILSSLSRSRPGRNFLTTEAKATEILGPEPYASLSSVCLIPGQPQLFTAVAEALELEACPSAMRVIGHAVRQGIAREAEDGHRMVTIGVKAIQKAVELMS